jgi:segregation and condensation protein B
MDANNLTTPPETPEIATGPEEQTGSIDASAAAAISQESDAPAETGQVAPTGQAGEPEAPAEQLVLETEAPAVPVPDEQLLAILEAVVYVTDEPLTADQMAGALGEPLPRIAALLERLVCEYNLSHHGLTIREVAGGYKMSTKPEHHDAIRAFVKKLQPPLKLSMAALETLAVIAYKQPVTAPEVMEIRGVQGAGVLKTLLDRKLITTAGRKNVIGRPIVYKTTKDFLVQFGLKDISELPTLKEFEELRRMSIGDEEPAVPAGGPAGEPPAAELEDSAEAAVEQQHRDPDAPAEAACTSADRQVEEPETPAVEEAV